MPTARQALLAHCFLSVHGSPRPLSGGPSGASTCGSPASGLLAGLPEAQAARNKAQRTKWQGARIEGELNCVMPPGRAIFCKSVLPEDEVELPPALRRYALDGRCRVRSRTGVTARCDARRLGIFDGACRASFSSHHEHM